MNDDAWRYKVGCGAQAVTEVSFPSLGPVAGSIELDITYDPEGLMKLLGEINQLPMPPDEIKDLHEEPDKDET